MMEQQREKQQEHEQRQQQLRQQGQKFPPPRAASASDRPLLEAPLPPAGSPLHGTCGWSDASLVRCGRFYPPAVKASSSSEVKLRHYSRQLPCVEVDTSTYAIPRADVTKRWASAAAPGFLFHVKAFGLFCSQSCQVSALPAEARTLLPPAQPAQQQQQQQFVRLGALPAGVEDACWRLFHAALEPLYLAGNLGLVVFQFHLGFQPSQHNLQYILRCRCRLDARFRMAAEVRCRSWFTDPSWRQQLCEALSMQGITLVSADELAHETAQRDREQTGLPAGAVRQVLPICLEVTTPDCHYVRVHRRHGTTDRLLLQPEIDAWAARLAEQLAPRLRGPCYFLWGTDWEDAPMVNAKKLDAALPAALHFDWRQHCRAAAPQQGSIQSLFAKQRQRQQQQQHAANEGGAAEVLESCSGSGSASAASHQQEQQKLCGSVLTTNSSGLVGPGIRADTAVAAASGRKRGRDGLAEASARGKPEGGGSSSRGGSILRFLQAPLPHPAPT